MKRILVFIVVSVIGFLIIHRLLYVFFGIGLPAFFPYRNRFNQQCVSFADNYKPPWFSIFYKYDQTCQGAPIRPWGDVLLL